MNSIQFNPFMSRLQVQSRAALPGYSPNFGNATSDAPAAEKKPLTERTMDALKNAAGDDLFAALAMLGYPILGAFLIDEFNDHSTRLEANPALFNDNSEE